MGEATDGYKQLVAQWTTITGVQADRIKAATILLAKNSGVDNEEIEGTQDQQVKDEMKQIENEAANMNVDDARADILVANTDKKQKTLGEFGFKPVPKANITDSDDNESNANSGGSRRRRRKTRSKSKYGKKSRRGGSCGCEKKKTKK